MKFVFPNHFNVYLHDTPAHAPFDRIEGDFSDGCVRLERPMDLAKYVLRDQPEWTEDKISAAMQVWEKDSVLKTKPDVHGHDRRHDAAAAPR